MPRYLHLLRHAQSADKQTGQTDKERMLTPTGLAEARAVGFFLKEKSLLPELIITSSAVRAKSTSQVIVEILSYPSEKIIVVDDLYEASVATFFQILSSVDQHTNSILIVGHNPVISFFANQVSQHQNSFLPAEVVTLKSEAIRWSELRKTNTEVTQQFHPMV